MNPALLSLQHLFLLHRLIDLDLDGPLAGQVRDAMDSLDRMLPEDQREALNAVSARLNAERDVTTAVHMGRGEELDRTLQWLADETLRRQEEAETSQEEKEENPES